MVRYIINRLSLLRFFIAAVILNTGWFAAGYSQVSPDDEEVVEIVVNFKVPKLIGQDIFAQYDNENLYLPLTTIFGLLEIYIETDFPRSRFSGFLITKNDKYEIDLVNLTGISRGQRFSLEKSDFFIMPQELYLRIDLFKQLFDLDMKFKFSTLEVILPLNEDFPSYKKLKRHQTQAKLQVRMEALKDVKILPRKRENFGGGVVDWVISASPVGGGGQYYSLDMGGMLLGGDFNIAGAGNTTTGFDSEQLNYKWHYYFDNNRYLSQAALGYVFTGGLLSRPLNGALVTNRPPAQRQYFQTVDISGTPGEGWEVELYINNKLTHFAHTDHAGEYNFSVDIDYGVTEVTLKLYGPNGEIKTETRHIGIPHSLIPKNSYEYTVAAGKENHYNENGTYVQANGYYGFSNETTFGLSADLPFTPMDGENPIMAGEAIYQIRSNLTSNTSLAPGYAIETGLNFYRPDLVSLNSSFTKFYENRYRNRGDQKYKFSFSASSPLKIRQRYYSIRYALSWNKFPQFSSYNMNYGFSASLFNLYINYLGRCKINKYSDRTNTDVASKFFISPHFTRWLRPQLRATYDHTNNQFAQYGIYFFKQMFKAGQLSLSFERHAISKSYQVSLTFKFWSNFADFTSRMNYTDSYLSVSQVQKGSVRYDHHTRRLLFNRRSGVGYGTAVVRPFMDNNFNGIIDEGEEYVPGLKARIKGGRQVRSGDQQNYYYIGLRAYDKYLVAVDKYSLNDPLLTPTHENYEVFCNPNIVTSIDVPLVTGSDINGIIERQVKGMKTGQGGIKLMILNISKDVITEISSFSNGQFYYLGLIPGSYRIYIDPRQLETSGYESIPDGIEFEIEAVEGGTSVEDINLLLVPKE